MSRATQDLINLTYRQLVRLAESQTIKSVTKTVEMNLDSLLGNLMTQHGGRGVPSGSLDTSTDKLNGRTMLCRGSGHLTGIPAIVLCHEAQVFDSVFIVHIFIILSPSENCKYLFVCIVMYDFA